MNETPRTDALAFMGSLNAGEVVVPVNFARQLEAELAEARAEIERLVSEIENKQYTITCADEENQQLKESLAEARAEIERKDKLIEKICKAALRIKAIGLEYNDGCGCCMEKDLESSEEFNELMAALEAAERGR